MCPIYQITKHDFPFVSNRKNDFDMISLIIATLLAACFLAFRTHIPSKSNQISSVTCEAEVCMPDEHLVNTQNTIRLRFERNIAYWRWYINLKYI